MAQALWVWLMGFGIGLSPAFFYFLVLTLEISQIMIISMIIALIVAWATSLISSHPKNPYLTLLFGWLFVLGGLIMPVTILIKVAAWKWAVSVSALFLTRGGGMIYVYNTDAYPATHDRIMFLVGLPTGVCSAIGLILSFPVGDR